MESYKADRLVIFPNGEQVRVSITLSDTPEAQIPNKPREAIRLLNAMEHLLKHIAKVAKEAK